MVTQYLVTQEANIKNTALKNLNSQMLELENLLYYERKKFQSKHDETILLRETLNQLKGEKKNLQDYIKVISINADAASSRASELSSKLDKQKKISKVASTRIDTLNQQLIAMRKRIVVLNEALDASSKLAAKSRAQVKDIDSRLNAVLARQLKELKRYRSDFFGRLRILLQSREDIRIVGDRFIFQSEVLFPSGKAKLSSQGLDALDKLANAILKLSKEIPKEIKWAIQVDGHTDIQPISSDNFPSNWELSTGRSMSVVRYLISRGVPPQRLVAAGYGEYQPLSTERTPKAMRRNRRIELKLTNR